MGVTTSGILLPEIIYGDLQFINWDLVTRGPETEKETRITVGVVTLKQCSIMVKSMSFGVQPN